MSLATRIKAFNILASRFDHKRMSDLTLEHEIDDNLLTKLHLAVFSYVSGCLPNGQFYMEEKILLEKVTEAYNNDEIPNMTPNGLFLPKRHLVVEYNYLITAFSDIVESLNVGDLISSWHIPLNLRYKDGLVSQSNVIRSHPTEHVHTDSWAGESSESVTIQIPIFGDIQRNYVSFYSAPEEFEESWLGPRTSYKDGEEITKKYNKVDAVPSKGHVQFSDCADMHASTRLDNAGPRISIDTTFVLKRPGDERRPEKIHKWREGERAAPEVISSIGSKYLMYFPDGNEDWVDNEGGHKHPSNCQLVKLQ